MSVAGSVVRAAGVAAVALIATINPNLQSSSLFKIGGFMVSFSREALVGHPRTVSVESPLQMGFYA